jgi:hypothetical protein
MIHYKPDGAVEQATYAHYGQAAKQLHKRLATWVRDGSQQDALYLFLAANLLIMYEVRLLRLDSRPHFTCVLDWT